MSRHGKGTEFCKFHLLNASKDMREPFVPMVLPALYAHLTNVKSILPYQKPSVSIIRTPKKGHICLTLKKVDTRVNKNEERNRKKKKAQN